ncbi:hypothetical protein MGG_15498 [Pyricularia oryzae 70-15]|uniref:Uncharacterized protein n=3 Tax=Pyricularia oryzae TaxID=318829 RepID=G4MXG3_PYRO7|nr:uncharacterized protein MGG_15498 [Pyricularia oryzae 70-15]EHA53493.1 hypothetical protein MGG_15498 [Pyricularia oryzae 70-15]ELQ35937.1 hypothetical protein OOU_Y34scaffold00679g20 [Pyricularia oryzae Y34]
MLGPYFAFACCRGDQRPWDNWVPESSYRQRQRKEGGTRKKVPGAPSLPIYREYKSIDPRYCNHQRSKEQKSARSSLHPGYNDPSGATFLDDDLGRYYEQFLRGRLVWVYVVGIEHHELVEKHQDDISSSKRLNVGGDQPQNEHGGD